MYIEFHFPEPHPHSRLTYSAIWLSRRANAILLAPLLASTRTTTHEQHKWEEHSSTVQITREVSTKEKKPVEKKGAYFTQEYLGRWLKYEANNRTTEAS